MARVRIAKTTKTLPNIRYMQAAGLGGATRTLHESSWLRNYQGTKLHEGSSAFRDDDEGGKRGVAGREEQSYWVPHYRTGIYYPRGHERVMDDIPEGAASFGEKTFWVRNMDGVDKADPVDHI